MEGSPEEIFEKRHGINSISTNTVLSSGIAERRRTEKKKEKKMKKNAKSIWRRRENPKREKRTKNSNIWRKIRENLGDDDEKGRMTLAETCA